MAQRGRLEIRTAAWDADKTSRRDVSTPQIVVGIFTHISVPPREAYDFKGPIELGCYGAHRANTPTVIGFVRQFEADAVALRLENQPAVIVDAQG